MKNTSNIFHFLFILHFRILSVVNILTFYSIVSEIVYIRNFLSTNLNLKLTAEQSKRCSYFLSLVFITKHKRPNLICLTHWLSFLSKNSVTPLFLTGDMVEDPTADQPWCILRGIHRIPLLSHTSAQFFLCTKLMSFLLYLLLNSLSKERMCTNSLTLQSPNGRSYVYRDWCLV